MNKEADSNAPQVAELDLAIPDMNSEDDEIRVSAALKGIKGIQFVRILPRGAFVRYHPDTIAAGAIVANLHHAGFRASTFQDSKTGKTGKSSQ
jgi:copper chaperone CopZ